MNHTNMFFTSQREGYQKIVYNGNVSFHYKVVFKGIPSLREGPLKN